MSDHLPEWGDGRSVVLLALEEEELHTADTLYRKAFDALVLPLKTVRRTHPNLFFLGSVYTKYAPKYIPGRICSVHTPPISSVTFSARPQYPLPNTSVRFVIYELGTGTRHSPKASVRPQIPVLDIPERSSVRPQCDTPYPTNSARVRVYIPGKNYPSEVVGYGLGKCSTEVFGQVWYGLVTLYLTLRYTWYMVRYELPVDVFRHPTLR